MTLLTSVSCSGEVHLVITNFNTAASASTNHRINTIKACGATPVHLIDGESKTSTNTSETIKKVYGHFSKDHLTSLGRPEVENVVDRVFVILPISESDLKLEISSKCKQLRIPVNVSDSGDLSSFSLMSTYQDGDFQLGVSTLGKGCKLASRIRRELVGHLPKNIGAICANVGQLRATIQAEDEVSLSAEETGSNDDDVAPSTNINSLVEEFNMTQEQQKLKRSRWLSQVVEYFPLSHLADVKLDDLLSAYRQRPLGNKRIKLDLESPQPSPHVARTGSISLVGAGPGSVSLLTAGAVLEICSADLVLADKLVPQQVLDLIPKNSTRLFIARKFPGNAEKAQQELLALGLEAVQKGEKVVRLKQGDPYIFGRGGEEFNFFKDHGFVPTVVPGISSALSGPVLANIPVTHREVADQVLICTGTGRRGVLPDLPDYVQSRTTIFLMALHRAVDLIPHLISEKKWDPEVPAAIIERSSCPDQRVIRTTLENVALAVEACGSRPPGLLVVGRACGVIENKPSERWSVEEGFVQVETDLDRLLRT